MVKLAHTMIRVRDLDAALEFYVGFIGLQEVARSNIGEEATLVFLGDGECGYYLELTYNHDGRGYQIGDQFGHLAFHVEDLEASVAEVEKRGWWYRRNRPTGPTSYIFLKDPDGYDVELLETPCKE